MTQAERLLLLEMAMTLAQLSPTQRQEATLRQAILGVTAEWKARQSEHCALCGEGAP